MVRLRPQRAAAGMQDCSSRRGCTQSWIFGTVAPGHYIWSAGGSTRGYLLRHRIAEWQSARRRGSLRVLRVSGRSNSRSTKARPQARQMTPCSSQACVAAHDHGKADSAQSTGRGKVDGVGVLASEVFCYAVGVETGTP